MKQLVVLIILAAGGYFVYQHFFSTPQKAAVMEESVPAENKSLSTGQLPPIPANCEALAKNLENAIYGAESGQVSFAQRNSAARKFRSCLREAGFSDAQINVSVTEIEERVKRYRGRDGGW